ncbi:MAG TPA: ATP-binding protein, partial [Thermoanaerobaculia bacterium]|nr:ATP-binding protein [Thermoanaerobaculia bacterium]
RIAGLGRVAASIAHEINNVLMGILPFAEIVSRSSEPVFRTAAEQIKHSVQRGRGVTQEILRFAREEKPAREIFAGVPWLESLATEVYEIIGGPGRFTMRLPERPFYLEADRPQLSQVLMNLLVNARDAIDPEGGRIELAVEITDAGTHFPFGALPPGQGRWVWIRVTDNGTGMGSETLARLFEPFFTTKHGGTGLGLPIAYRIVAAHEGLLFVESGVGKGTTFHVFLPESDAPTPVAAEEVRERPLSGEVLLVEDDETVAVGLGFILEDAGMRVRNAGSGRAALAELARSRPDIMILDVGLPDMPGDEVCEQALALWPGLPVIFSTGHGDASRLSAFLERPQIRFLMKPYTFEQLRNAMEGVLGVTDSG